jgi:hypothetical protein
LLTGATSLTAVLTRWSLARQQVGGGVDGIAYSSLALLTLLARWLDEESAAGRMAVLARWVDEESAARRMAVLAHRRNVESAAGLTAVLARWRDFESALGLTAVLAHRGDVESAAELVARWRNAKSAAAWMAMLALLACWLDEESVARRMDGAACLLGQQRFGDEADGGARCRSPARGQVSDGADGSARPLARL